jgi:hypothetical protein
MCNIGFIGPIFLKAGVFIQQSKPIFSIVSSWMLEFFPRKPPQGGID